MPSPLKPGDIVRIAGTYALVNRYGRSIDLAMRREVGERLPVAVAADGPIGYVLVGATETAKAA